MPNRDVTIKGTEVGLDVNKVSIYKSSISASNLVAVVPKSVFMSGYSFSDDDQQEDYVCQADDPCRTVLNLSIRVKNQPPTVTITGDTSSLTNANITLTANANDPEGFPMTYLWSTGETTQSITVTSATAQTATYTVTVTDNVGDTATDSHSIVWSAPTTTTTTSTTTTSTSTTTTTTAAPTTTTTTAAPTTTTTTAAPTTTTTTAATTTTTTAYSPSGFETELNGITLLVDSSADMNRYAGVYNATNDITSATGGENYGSYCRFTSYNSPFNLWITGLNNGSDDVQNIVLVNSGADLRQEQSVWINGSEITFSSVGANSPYISIAPGWSMQVVFNGVTNGTNSDEFPPNTYPGTVYPDTSSAQYATAAYTEAHAFFTGTVSANWPSGTVPALPSIYRSPLNNSYTAPAGSAFKIWTRVKRDSSVSASTRPPVMEFRSYQTASYGSNIRGGNITSRGFFN